VRESTQRFTGKVIAVRTDSVEMPAGQLVERDVVVHPGAVGVIALDDRERVLLVQQYRHAPGRLLWEPPAGLLDAPGKPPQDTAARELYEEAGYRAGHWGVLVDFFTSPGMSDEAMRVYLARDLAPVTVVGVLAAVAARASGYATLRPADAPWPERPTGAAG